RVSGILAPVVGEDGVAERRRGHPGVAGVDAHVDAVRDEYLDRAALGRQRQGVRVAAEEERSGDALAATVVDDGLGGRDDVLLVEARRERGSAVPAGAEGDALGRHGRVGDPVVVGGDQLVDIDEIVFLRGEASSARHALQSAARVPDAHLRRETVVAETGWGAGTRLAG